MLSHIYIGSDYNFKTYTDDRSDPLADTVECRYNAVKYNIIFFKALQQLGHNFITGELCGVFCQDLGEIGPHYNGTAL